MWMTGRPRPLPDQVHTALRLRARRRRGRVRGALRPVGQPRGRPSRRRVDAGGRLRREHVGDHRPLRHRQPGPADGLEHRPHPRDLSAPRTVGSPAGSGRAPPASSTGPCCTGSSRRKASPAPTSSARSTGPRTTRPTPPKTSSTAIQTALEEWLARHTNQELYELACEHNLLIAPAMTPREMFQNEQLYFREFYEDLGGYEHFPHRFVIVTSADGEAAPATATRPAPALGSSEPTWSGAPAVIPAREGGPGAWSGVNVIEFGSGAAGPISTRYFVEHGATVLRIESASRPDFLRVDGARAEEPARARGLAALRRAQRRQAQRDLQPEGPARGRAGEAAHARVGRRRGRELRPPRDEGVRPRLRVAGIGEAEPGDGRARASTARPAPTRTTPDSARRAPPSPGSPT